MSNPTRQVALTSEVSNNEISPSELEQVAVALQEQAADGLARAWHDHATVQSFTDPSKILPHFWPIKISDNIDAPGAAGYHSDENGQPYSIVQFEAGAGGWPLTSSHEFCEMLGDPYGNHLARMLAPDFLNGVSGSRRYVRWLKELCDPCEDVTFAYHSAAEPGVLLSDFILHQYANGLTGPFSATGAIKSRGQVQRNGYISWVEDDGTWMQLTNFEGEGIRVNNLGKSSGKPANMTLREWVDQHEEGASQRLLRIKQTNQTRDSRMP